MKIRSLVVFLAALLIATPALAKLSYSQWNRFKRDFNRDVKKSEEKVLEALKNSKGYDDPRVAELIAEKTLFHSNSKIADMAFEVLGQFSEKSTIDEMVDQARRARKMEEKLRYILLMGKYTSKNRKLARFLQNELGDRDWQVVSAALRSVAMLKMTDAQKYVERVYRKNRDSHPRLAYEAARTLSLLTGKPYSKYLKGKSLIFPEKIFSKRVAFIIATPEFMKREIAPPRDYPVKKGEEKPKKVTMLELVQKSMEDVLDRLDSSTYFNVLTFSGMVKGWNRNCRRATSRNISSAKSFIKRPFLSTGGDVLGAIKRAMKDDDLDTIYLVGASLPSGGFYNKPERILREIRKLNADRYVQINTTTLLVKPMTNISQVTQTKIRLNNDKIKKFYDDLAKLGLGTARDYQLTVALGSSGTTAKADVPKFEIKKEKGKISYSEWRRVKEKLEEAIQSPGKPGAINVIRTVAAADDERAAKEIMRDALTSKNYEVIRAAVEGLQKCRDKDVLSEIATRIGRTRDTRERILLIHSLRGQSRQGDRTLSRLVRGSDWRFASAAIQAMKDIGATSSTSALKRRARRSKTYRISYEAAEALEKITGSRPSGFPRPGSGLFPKKLDSNQVLFAISQSQGMGNKVEVSKEDYKKYTGKEFSEEGKPAVTLLDIAKHSLVETIEALPKGVEFTVVGYSAQIRFWRRNLQRTTSSNKRSAKKFVENLRVSIDHDVFGLYRAAARIKDLDTIYLVGDRPPSGGFVTNPKKVLERVAMDNLENYIRIHVRAMLVNPPKDMDKVQAVRIKVYNEKVSSFLRDLSRQNLGSYNSFFYTLKK